MSRPLRVQFEGALFHVFARGNEKRRIFLDDEDHHSFLTLLGETVSDFRWRLYEYALIPNHFHLALEITEKNLSAGMQALNGRYAQRFNRKRDRVGHLFQGRFKSLLVEEEGYFFELLRYIALNPVRAGLVDRPEDWRWSSYCANAGLKPAPSWLQVDGMLANFSQIRARAIQMYRAFVAAGLAPGILCPFPPPNQVYIGSESFRKRIETLSDEKKLCREYPIRDIESPRPAFGTIVDAVLRRFRISADELRSRHGGEARIVMAYLARHDGCVRNEEVRNYLRLSPAGASKLARKGDGLVNDRGFMKTVAEIRKYIVQATQRPLLKAEK